MDLEEREAKIEKCGRLSARAPGRVGDEEEAKTMPGSVVSYNKITNKITRQRSH
jgi:hypothetical protein